ncbi:MAG: hypothetical protein ABW039_11280 [Sphingobium sp.]
MSDLPPDTPEERAREAAAIRRRWITLGEVLAVLAVAISALTLYLNWADRQDERAEKAAQSSKASTRAATLVLSADGVTDDRMTLEPADPEQVAQSQTVLFPEALGLAPVDTTGDPRIEADWFADALKKARQKARLPDDSVGDERLPVAITTRFVVDGEAHEAVALYDIGYGISGRLFAGHDVKLRGLSRVSALKAANAQLAVDARWASLRR